MYVAFLIFVCRGNIQHILLLFEFQNIIFPTNIHTCLTRLQKTARNLAALPPQKGAWQYQLRSNISTTTRPSPYRLSHCRPRYRSKPNWPKNRYNDGSRQALMQRVTHVFSAKDFCWYMDRSSSDLNMCRCSCRASIGYLVQTNTKLNLKNNVEESQITLEITFIVISPQWVVFSQFVFINIYDK